MPTNKPWFGVSSLGGPQVSAQCLPRSAGQKSSWAEMPQFLSLHWFLRSQITGPPRVALTLTTYSHMPAWVQTPAGPRSWSELSQHSPPAGGGERSAERSHAHHCAMRQEGGRWTGSPLGQTLGGENLGFLSRMKSGRERGQRMASCPQEIQVFWGKEE